MTHKVTKKDLRAALVAAEWNKSKAAKALGIHRATVVKLMEQYKIKLPKHMTAELTKVEVIKALEKHDFNKTAAAEYLGIHRVTLGKVMKHHEIEPPVAEENDTPVLDGSIAIETKRVKKGVPRALWWLASPLSGRHAAAAVFHDLHYATHLVSKDLADKIFYHGMLYLGVNKVKAWLLYQAVKWFGGSSYDHDKMTPLMYPEDSLTVQKFYGDTT